MTDSGYSAFVSYRRDGGAYIARAIREGIEKANEALRIFIDLDELASGNFNDALLEVIEATPNFILIVSAGLFDRCSSEHDWVRREIAAAVRAKKNIIPVFEEGVLFPEPSLLPEEIRAVVEMNGVIYTPQFHHEAIKKIVSFFNTDDVESAEEREVRIKKFFERRMVRLCGGEFAMGSPNGRMDELPFHTVSVKPFWIMKFPVTQKEYQGLMNVNPANFKHDHKPVQNVSWFDAVTFCNKWSTRDGIEPVYEIDRGTGAVHIEFKRLGYRLPTEAEWEYACRAGTQTIFHWGDSEDQWDKYAWHDRNSDDQVHVVGSRLPNPFGLYDMTGNVFEWCNDWYERDYYSFYETDNPRGPDREFGEYRVMRGGAWACDPLRLRSAARLKRDPALIDDISGFRCVIEEHPLVP